MNTKYLEMVGLFACASFVLATSTLAGSITGTVTFSGPVPKLRPLELTDECKALHGDNPPENEVLVLGDGQTMANILVRVTKGYPEKEYPPPSEPVVLTQKGCQYAPHVFVVQVGQPLKILNPDGILHNVHGMPAVNPAFNRAMPKMVESIDLSLTKPEPPFEIKCDIHRWMHAYCAVLDNPFWSVTKKDGVYTIDGLDPGEYEIEAWHEKLGTQTATVTVTNDGPAKHDFTFARPERK